MSKEAAAEILYKDGVEQKDIARILKLSENTISKYAVKSEWKKKRLTHSIKKATAEEDSLTALAHQSLVIRLISDRLGEQISENLTVDELKKLLIPKGEVDALQKLFTTVKNKELDWSAIVKIIREFSGYLKNENLQLAQDIVPFIDDYINLKRKSS